MTWIIKIDDAGKPIAGTETTLPAVYENISNPTVGQMLQFGYIGCTQPEEEPSTPYIPQSISMRQCRLYLYDLDDGTTLQAVENYALTLSPKAQIEWNTSHEVWRASPMVEQMRLMFGWSVEQMDEMFIDAAKL